MQLSRAEVAELNEWLERYWGKDEQLMPIIEGREREYGPLAGGRRPSGLCAGQLKLPDDFDAPLPEEVLRGFEG